MRVELRPFSQRLREFQVALMLLTRLPAGRLADPVPTMGASGWAWPLAGLPVGGLAGLAFLGGFWLGLGPVMAAFLAVAAGILATGAMHEDGLADMADGCGGGQDRARKLEIMRDSRIGSYGVLALILVVGMRAAALAALATPELVIPALIGLAVASRACLSVLIWLLPPARGDGLGRGASELGRGRALVAALIGLLCLSAFPVALPAVVVAAACVAWIAYRQLGGQTGDILGAAQQLAELAGLLALVAAAS